MFEGDVLTFDSRIGAFTCDPGPSWCEHVVIEPVVYSGDLDRTTGYSATGAYASCVPKIPLKGENMRVHVDSTCVCAMTCNGGQVPIIDGSLPLEVFSIEIAVPPNTFLKKVSVENANLANLPNIVFLVTGQSNSLGVGGVYEAWNPEDSPEEGVLGWNCMEGRWQTARLDDFSLGMKPPNLQCFGLHFAKYFKRRYPKANVGIVVVGEGGQSISRWSKAIGSADIFDASVAVTRAALACSWASSISGILWSQGQADHTLEPNMYRAILRGVIDQYRACEFCDCNTPFVACELPGKKYDFSQETQIDALRALDRDSDENTIVIKSSNLETSDFWHFSTASHRELGRRFLMGWARILRGNKQPRVW